MSKLIKTNFSDYDIQVLKTCNIYLATEKAWGRGLYWYETINPDRWSGFLPEENKVDQRS